jgi:dTDP-4-amino-4,6-dideoxygalactose transaminase
MYYLLLNSLEERANFISAMKAQEIHCVFHYVPLHSAPYGLQAGRANGDLSLTVELSERLVRLPMWIGLEGQQLRAIHKMLNVLK